MMWTYRITAVTSPRTLMRVALIFDQQFMNMERCVLQNEGNLTTVHIIVCADEVKARRVHAKLYHLHDLRTVELAAGTDEEAARGFPAAGQTFGSADAGAVV